jgi:hypothetical protein
MPTKICRLLHKKVPATSFLAMAVNQNSHFILEEAVCKASIYHHSVLYIGCLICVSFFR